MPLAGQARCDRHTGIPEDAVWAQAGRCRHRWAQRETARNCTAEGAWHAIRVLPGWEGVAYQEVEARGFEAFLRCGVYGHGWPAAWLHATYRCFRGTCLAGSGCEAGGRF